VVLVSCANQNDGGSTEIDFNVDANSDKKRYLLDVDDENDFLACFAKIKKITGNVDPFYTHSLYGVMAYTVANESDIASVKMLSCVLDEPFIDLIADPSRFEIPGDCHSLWACTAVLGPFENAFAEVNGKKYATRHPKSTCCQLAGGIAALICDDNTDPEGVIVSCER